MDTSYITSAQKAEQLPRLESPEVAFIGRSNTGKSSLLNALLGRTRLARTSSTPGRTQMVNFFALRQGDAQLTFADLPGYGYSAIGQSVRHHWERLVKAYLDRPNVREYLFLLDVRRAPAISREDLDLLAYLQSRCHAVATAAEVSIVLTKCDKVSQRELAAAQAALKSALAAEGLTVAHIYPCSALHKTGIAALRDRLLTHLAH